MGTDTDTDRGYAEDYARNIARELAELDAGRVDDETHETPYAAVLAWAEGAALDAEYTLSAAGGLRGVSILRTSGGPGCWVDAHGDGTATVRVTFGRERAAYTCRAEAFDAWAWDYAEAITGAR